MSPDRTRPAKYTFDGTQKLRVSYFAVRAAEAVGVSLATLWMLRLARPRNTYYLPAGMLALRLRFLAPNTRLQFQQLQLQVAQLLALLAVLGDPRQAKPFFQYLNLPPYIVQFPRVGCDLFRLPIKLLRLGLDLLL
jgi:hypothetical protein